ncbi:hypothetical protein C1H46_012584 [Malus baccata]|uniref:UBR-type domain-containing protein n=1 Tax=Malus baccata TaxID=106549 RepID=A0A540MSL7_MALBA|nr:hypothetical protein C1H46_012584 [Malus baccata]
MDSSFEDEAEHTVSIQEYLKDVEEQELEADLVLGGDEGKECTYNNGYMKRQAIFSCLTCTPDGNAGVCTACSLSCHDGHENFKGSYCTCSRPYPDPDVEEQVEMIQCCVCEDWFHEEHIGLDSSDEIPRDEEGEPLYEDFICKGCSAVCSFIRLYNQTILASGSQKDAPVETAKDKKVLSDMPLACRSGKLENDISQSSDTISEPVSGGDSLLLGENSGKNTDSDQCITDANAPVTCVIGVNLVVASPVSECKPMFLLKNWRDALCKCEKCSEFYEQKHIRFLLDKEDSIMEYEKMAKQKREEKLQQQEGAELTMLDKLGHVEKIEILSGIADMKDELRSFLGSFDPSKTITSADVHQIFENLAKKRRRVE